MKQHHTQTILSIFLISCVLISLSLLPIKAKSPSEDFMNWLETHQTTGGTYTLQDDVVISRNLYLHYDIAQPSIINTGDYTITVEKNCSLVFFNSNIQIQGNTTLFLIEKGASLEFSDLVTTQEAPANSLSTKHGPAVLIDGGSFYILSGGEITADQGTAVQSLGNGFINLHDTVIHGDPAVLSQDRVILSTSELFGQIQAPTIEAELTLFHSNPEIKQDIYHLTYQDVTSDVHTEGSRYVNTVPDTDLRTIVPKTTEMKMYTGNFQIRDCRIPIPLIYDSLPRITSKDIGKTISIPSSFQFTEFQRKLIDAGLLDVSTAKAPTIEVKVLRNDLQFGISFSNHYILCAAVSFPIPPDITGYQDVYFEISQDGIDWMSFPLLSSFDTDFMDYEAYAALDNTFQDRLGNTFELEYNHTYHIRMGVKNGPMKGVSTPLIIKITTDILDLEFFNPIGEDSNGVIEHPDQAPPDDDDSIDGNRGGGGQKEGQRDKNISSSSYETNGSKTQADNTAGPTTNGSNADKESSNKAAITAHTTEKPKRNRNSADLSLTLPFFILIAFGFAGISCYFYRKKKSV